ncbi:MAG: hypothetical protein WKF60_05670 [Ilumatobacter sp.]
MTTMFAHNAQPLDLQHLLQPDVLGLTITRLSDLVPGQPAAVGDALAARLAVHAIYGGASPG